MASRGFSEEKNGAWLGQCANVVGMPARIRLILRGHKAVIGVIGTPETRCSASRAVEYVLLRRRK